MNDAEKKWCNVKLSLILYGKLCAFRVQRYENFVTFQGHIHGDAIVVVLFGLATKH
jgi:hypothetical protein